MKYTLLALMALMCAPKGFSGNEGRVVSEKMTEKPIGLSDEQKAERVFTFG